MKNFTLLFFLIFALTFSLSGQGTIQIGSGTSTSNWIPYSSLTQVYTGDISAVANTWNEITFDSPFNYNGTDNIVEAVDENTPGGDCHAYWRAFSTGSGNERFLLYRSDSINPDPSSPTSAMGSYSHIAEIQFEGQLASCLPPTALTLDSKTQTTADISWTAGGSETAWYVSWGTPGYTPGGTGEIDSAYITSNSFQITGLTAGTSYDVYVQADCGGGDLSAWVGPLHFTTICGSLTPPWTESFESVGIPALPNCWLKDSYTWQTSDNYYYVGDADAHTGTQFLTVRWEATYDYIWTPGYNLTAGTSYDFTFWWAGDDLSGWSSDLFINSTQSSSGATLVGNIVSDSTVTSKTYSLYTYRFTPTSSGTYYFGVRTTCQNYYGGNLNFDDFALNVTPSCPYPITLTLDSITTTTADISYTPGGSETVWNVSWGTPGYTPGDSSEIGNVNTTNNPYKINGLSPNTSYDVYVQADCGGGDLSTWTGPLKLKTGCQNLPWAESFETVTYPWFPDCWLRPDYSWETINNSDSPYDANAHTGNSFARVDWYANDSYIWTPGYSLTAGTSYDFFFWWAGDDKSGWSSDLYVNTAQSGYNATFIGNIVSNTSTTSKVYRFRKFTFTPTTSGTYYFGIQTTRGGAGLFLSYDDFGVNVTPSCPFPSSFSLNAVTQTTADVTWTTGGSEQAWNISWGTPGYTPGGTGEIDSAPTTSYPYQITGLSDGTYYDVYIQSNCGNGSLSSWIGPLHFKTVCSEETLPWTEGFESVNVPAVPHCWSIEYDSWQTAIGSNYAHSGTKFLQVTTSAQNDYVWTSGFNLTAGTSYDFTFWWAGTGIPSWNCELYMNNVQESSGATMVGTIVSFPDTAYSTYSLYRYTFTPTTNGIYYFGIKATYVTNSFYLNFDDFALNVSPSCRAPSALTIDSITGTTADIFWTVEGTETAWNVSWGNPGYTPGGTGEIDSAHTTSNPYQIIGLSPLTTYDVYVQADCDSGDLSTWVGPLSFTTLCGSVIAPWTEGFESGTDGTPIVPNLSCWNQEYESGTTNWAFADQNENGSIFPHGGALMAEFRVDSYGPTTKLITPSLDLTSLTTPQLTFYFANVDWYGYTDELRVYYKSDVSDAGWTLIPGAVYTAAHASWQKVDLVLPNSSGASNYVIAFEGTSHFANGLDLDDISIAEGPSCPDPTALTLDSKTQTTADISWTPTGSESSWKVSWGTPNYTPEETGEIGNVNTTSNPYQITGLSAGTSYDVYVQADCGSGDLSTWLGPLNFKTSPVNDDCAGAIAFSTIPTDGSCVTMTVNTGAATPSGDSSCGGTADDDVWYSFAVPSGYTRINYSNTNISGSSDRMIELLDGCSGAVIGCFDPETGFFSGLTGGSTYLIRVYTYSSGDYTEFDMCLSTPPPPPANDDCAGAIAFPTIPTDGSCVTVTVNTEGAASSGESTCSGTADDDVWYSFTVPSGETSISYINTNISGSSDRMIELLDGCSGTALGCFDNESGTFTGLTGGSTYLIRIYTNLSGVNTEFDMCLSGPPPNDDCSEAMELIVTPGLASSVVIGSMVGATASMTSDNGCDSYSSDEDVWYKCTVPASGNVTIEGYVTGGSEYSNDYSLQVYTGTCDSLVNVDCDENGGDYGPNDKMPRLSLTGRTGGEVLYLRIRNAPGDRENFAIAAYDPSTALELAPGTCGTGQSVTIDVSSGNGYRWVPLLDGSGNIIAAIYAYGQDLGTVSASSYVNPGSGVRQDGNGVYYLDRNSTITVQNQPTSSLYVLIFFTDSELSALQAVDPGVTSAADLNATMFEDPCGEIQSPTGVLLTNAAAYNMWTGVKCNQYATTSFSNFFLHGGNVPLPVTVVFFDARLDNDKAVVLYWNIADELNLDKYIVERSKDSRAFVPIVSMSAINSKTYSTLDKHPINGINYYRLKMVDVDGKYSYSKVRMATVHSERSITLYPNPASDLIIISGLESLERMIHLTVYNEIGILVWKGEVQGSTLADQGIDMSFLSSGLYNINVLTPTTSETLRFIKQ